MGSGQFWIDRGGIVSDVVARDSAGRTTTAQLLSEDQARHGGFGKVG